MSFSSDLKTEIIKYPPKNPCCRRAFLDGILSAVGDLSENEISFRLQKGPQTDLVRELVREIFGKDAARSVSTQGGRGTVSKFSSPSASRYIGSIDSTGIISYTEKCPFCLGYFIKGIFFARGRAKDPRDGFSLELSLSRRSSAFQDFFAKNGIQLQHYVRGGEEILYTKNSSVMENFFGLCGMQYTMFEIINEKIKKSILGNANRHRNIDTGNITRAVNAASEQIEIIRRLEDRNLLASLPPELEAMARLRLEYPDKSLSQLAMISVPEITKSGINHRMKKLMLLGKELLKNPDLK